MYFVKTGDTSNYLEFEVSKDGVIATVSRDGVLSTFDLTYAQYTDLLSEMNDKHDDEGQLIDEV